MHDRQRLDELGWRDSFLHVSLRPRRNSAEDTFIVHVAAGHDDMRRSGLARAPSSVVLSTSGVEFHSLKTLVVNTMETPRQTQVVLSRSPSWEYFNEFVGGSSNAYHLFSDEGVNLGQR